MSPKPYVAVDEGTTNRRAYLIEDGKIVRVERDGMDVLGIPPGASFDAVAKLHDRFER